SYAARLPSSCEVVHSSLMREIVIDTETPDSPPLDGHRIVEIGAVELVNRSLTGQTFHCYVPATAMPADALAVHGLSRRTALYSRGRAAKDADRAGGRARLGRQFSRGQGLKRQRAAGETLGGVKGKRAPRAP